MCSSRRIARDAREVAVERLAIGARGSATRKPFSSQHVERLALVAGQRVERRRVHRARSSSAATSGDTTSCASVSVFIRNTSSRLGSGTRRLNMEDCIAAPGPHRELAAGTWLPDRILSADALGQRATHEAATRVPVDARRACDLAGLLKEIADRVIASTGVDASIAAASRGQRVVPAAAAATSPSGELAADESGDCGEQANRLAGRASFLTRCVRRRAADARAGARRACPSCISTCSMEFQGIQPSPVTFQPLFSSARRMKFRSNVLVASSNRLSVRAPCGSSCAKWNSSGRSSSEM